MSRLLLGTSSWSAKDWVGPFYPEGARPAEFLGLYARRYSTVEADTTYYGVPRATLVEGWRERTPDGFLLAAKFPRTIVHAGEGPRPDVERLLVPAHVAAETEAFLAAMALLGDRCGPLVLQFPYLRALDRDTFLERLDAYLGALPAEFRYAVEVRNRGWLGEPLMELLRRHRTACVLSDFSTLPHPLETARRLDVVTTDFVYARLIGDRRAVESRTKTFDKLVLDRDDRLAGWVELLDELLPRVKTIFLYANNHYAGFGPGTLARLQELLDARAGQDG